MKQNDLKKSISDKKLILITLSLIEIFLLLIIFETRFIDPSEDAYYFYNTAIKIFKGNYVLSSNIYNFLFPYVLAPFCFILPSLNFFRILNTFFLILSLYTLYRIIIKLNFDEKYAIMGVLLYFSLPFLTRVSTSLLREPLFLLINLNCILLLFKNTEHVSKYILIGITLALGSLIRYEGYVLIFVTNLIVIYLNRERLKERKIIRNISILFLSSISGIIFWMIYNSIFFGNFLAFVTSQDSIMKGTIPTFDINYGLSSFRWMFNEIPIIFLLAIPSFIYSIIHIFHHSNKQKNTNLKKFLILHIFCLSILGYLVFVNFLGRVFFLNRFLLVPLISIIILFLDSIRKLIKFLRKNYRSRENIKEIKLDFILLSLMLIIFGSNIEKSINNEMWTYNYYYVYYEASEFIYIYEGLYLSPKDVERALSININKTNLIYYEEIPNTILKQDFVELIDQYNLNYIIYDSIKWEFNQISFDYLNENFNLCYSTNRSTHSIVIYKT